MPQETFERIPLTLIAPSLMNPRKSFDVSDLLESVRSKGVIQPVVIRPIEPALCDLKRSPTKGLMVQYEIVAGERRFHARCAVAMDNGGIESADIPAVIRDLSDDEAYDLMAIENLQRKDLTEVEEAEAFRDYLARHKDDQGALDALAERTGIKPRYIRRRVAIMALPAKVLKAWEAGKLLYGHLEQILRLQDPKAQGTMAKETVQYGWTVGGLKRTIDNQAPAFKNARFSLEKAGCLSCHKNSDIQKNLFDIGGERARCLDPKCFKKKQNDWFMKNWKKTGFFKKHHTNGFRFEGDLGYSQFINFKWEGKKPLKKCRECPNFITILNLDGTANHNEVCIGDKSCFKALGKKAGKDSKSGNDAPAPRAAWHGGFFRDAFYKDQITMRLKETPPDDEKALRISLAAFLVSNQSYREWFAKTIVEKEPDEWGYVSLSHEDIWLAVKDFPLEEVRQHLRQGALHTSLHDLSEKARERIGSYLGADLKRDFRITEEYLKKKTVGEIHALAEKYGLWDRKETQTFLYETLNKKRGKFKSCKKGELIRLFMESGVDLAGVIPGEILPEEEA